MSRPLPATARVCKRGNQVPWHPIVVPYCAVCLRPIPPHLCAACHLYRQHALIPQHFSHNSHTTTVGAVFTCSSMYIVVSVSPCVSGAGERLTQSNRLTRLACVVVNMGGRECNIKWPHSRRWATLSLPLCLVGVSMCPSTCGRTSTHTSGFVNAPQQQAKAMRKRAVGGSKSARLVHPPPRACPPLHYQVLTCWDGVAVRTCAAP
mmetsp:Transcript_69758/g.102208  ORF Transcript_69758/g.102208 Transcript_69758/m.102208 type:complete len:206 (+) Transcript_69758:446-1063(+)